MALPTGVGGGSYAMQRAFKEVAIKIAQLESTVQIQGQQIKTLLDGKGGVEAAVAVAKEKTLADLKISELKALCTENGIDFVDFGNTKAPYIEALKAKGLK